MPIVDTHQHYWRTGAQEQPWLHEQHATLLRDFEPEDLAPALAAEGVDRTVVMQSVDEPAENDRLAHYAAEATVAGVVTWLPVARPEEALAELDRIRVPKHVGVRCLIARDPLEWLSDERVLDVFREIAARGLAWDVVPVTAEQTRSVVRLADAVPDLRIVVDHLGRPPVDAGDWRPWADNVVELAGRPNVSMKVSIGIDVLTAWPEWDAQAVRPYVDHVAAHFGPERLMLASNWPVVLLRTDYVTAWRDLREMLLARYGDDASRDRVLGGTATAVYRLDRFATTTDR